LCFPSLPLGLPLARPGALPEPFDRRQAVFCMRGSVALWQALKALRLKAGQSVLFPSYHCGIELDVLRKAGLDVAFYRIGRDLRADPDELRRAARPGAAAVFVIHYFGFAQPLDEVHRLCRERGWALIEDCAQALYTKRLGRTVGTTGDVAIFSLFKSLPLAGGGALLVNNPDLPRIEPAGRPPRFHVTRQIVRVLGRSVLASSWMRLASFKRLADGLRQAMRASNATSIAFRLEWAGARMDRLSRRMFRRIPHEEIVRRRRQNFAALLEAAAGCRRLVPLIGRLDDGACPGFFPVTIPDGAASFIEFSRERGLQAEVFWPHLHPDFPADRFPDARWLKEQAVILPVHQGLRDEDLARVREVIAAWERSR
jgi:dTDP-4-amino-4,6-dideoxygalactose transaminase